MTRRAPTAGPGWIAGAALDPWLVVSDGVDEALFGYAVRHPGTGGLAWTLSTPLRHLDVARGRATTASGRRYDLGHRLEVPDLPDEEARISYAVLVCPLIGIDPAVHLGALDPLLAADWVRACKVARHLGVDPPVREAASVARFLDRHADRYAAVLRAKLAQ
jgi:hypothetical protein